MSRSVNDFLQKNRKRRLREVQKSQKLSVASKSLASTVYGPVIWPPFVFSTPSSPPWPSVSSRRLRMCWSHWRVSCVVSLISPHPAERGELFLTRSIWLKSEGSSRVTVRTIHFILIANHVFVFICMI